MKDEVAFIKKKFNTRREILEKSVKEVENRIYFSEIYEITEENILVKKKKKIRKKKQKKKLILK